MMEAPREKAAKQGTEGQKKQAGKARNTKGKRYWRGVLLLAGATILLNVLACIQGFCDWYKKTVYGWISDLLGRMTGWFPVALGELLMYLGAVAVAVGILLPLLLLFLRKKAGSRRFAAVYGKTLLFAGALLLLIYTLNWVIPFRASILQVKGAVTRGYTLEELQKVRNHIVLQLNACAEEVERDGNGRVIYDHEAMASAVFQAMKAQAADYPLLAGYYPPMKAALCSDFLDWMNIGGYTYPYTMEITWNHYCNDLYYPALLAHESAHHQGYYQENEANFLEFLACTESEDPLLRYAGYNEVYYYVQNAYLGALFTSLSSEGAKALARAQPKVSDLVQKDRQEARDASVKKYEAASHPAQDLAPTAAKVADVGWNVQGDLLKENSYDGVVKMVLEYYDAKGMLSP